MSCFGKNCRKSTAAVAPVPLQAVRRSPEDINAADAYLQSANPRDDIRSFTEGYKIGKRGVTAVPLEGPGAEEDRIANAIYATHGNGYHAVSFKNGYILGRRAFIIALNVVVRNNQENNPGPPVGGLRALGGLRKKTRRSKTRRSKLRKSKSRRLRQ